MFSGSTKVPWGEIVVEHVYRLVGQVFDGESQRGVPNLLVEVWDSDFLADDLLCAVTTDETGKFSIELDPSDYQEPDVYFKVFEGRKLLTSTEDWLPLGKNGEFIVIPVSMQELHRAF